MVKSNWVVKGIYIMVILVSICICFLGIRSNTNQEQLRKVEHAKSTIKDEVIRVKRLNKKISQFYQNDQEEFLAEPIEKEELRGVERSIITLKTEAVDFGIESKDFSANTSEVTQGKKELMVKMEDIKNKRDIQNQVTELLVQAPTDWTAGNGEIVIKESATAEKISKIRNNISKTETQWSTAITTFLDEMDTQVKQYKDIKQSIDIMEQDGGLTSDATIENIILIFNQLPQIKNEALKKDLFDKLDIIDKKLEKQEIGDLASGQEEALSSE